MQYLSYILGYFLVHLRKKRRGTNDHGISLLGALRGLELGFTYLAHFEHACPTLKKYSNI